MRIKRLHSWKISPKEAIGIQGSLASQVIQTGHLEEVKFIAGADISTEKDSTQAYAGVVVMTYPGLEVVEERGVVFELSFPYVPGLLAFREAPPLLKVFEEIRHEPDLILFDGQGIAHPRGLGIASHIGLLLDKPSIGCAKSLLFGHFEGPAVEQGAFSYLYDKHKNVIGAVVRTRTEIQPVFVSIGHRIDLPTAIKFILSTCCGYRLPEPIRHAHNFVNRLRTSQGQPADQLTLL
ncbi:MAG: deoxyribonuclease V [Nitrospira sp.]|nr:deoxyribonuclease V [Nitrospira sp.]